MSGRAHEVMSGLVVARRRRGAQRAWSGPTVVFSELGEAEKERYVRFGEWRGRSGGYAIQTLGSTLVERLEGSVSNVVGLPVGLLAELAPELFALLSCPGCRTSNCAVWDDSAPGNRRIHIWACSAT